MREFWLDLTTEWFHKKFPTKMTKPPHQHEIIHVIEYSAIDQLTRALWVAEKMLDRISNNPTGDSSGIINNRNNWTDWAKDRADKALAEIARIKGEIGLPVLKGYEKI